MNLNLEIEGHPRIVAGRARGCRALYLAVVYRTTTPRWLWWRVWHLRPAWPPLTKVVDNFVEQEG